jgi:hypothetical protein
MSGVSRRIGEAQQRRAQLGDPVQRAPVRRPGEDLVQRVQAAHARVACGVAALRCLVAGCGAVDAARQPIEQADAEWPPEQVEAVGGDVDDVGCCCSVVFVSG